MSLLAATPIIFLVTFAAKGPGFQEMEACSLLVNLRKGMQRSSEQPLVGEERYVATLTTAAKETTLIKVEIWMGDQSLRSSLRISPGLFRVPQFPLYLHNAEVLKPSNFAIRLVFLTLKLVKRSAFQNKRIAVLQLGFGPEKCLGPCEKQALE